MALEQNEIQELLELFPNSKAAIERFTNSQSKQKEALDKMANKIKQLKSKLSDLKLKKAEERAEFTERLSNFFSSYYCPDYSDVDVFLAGFGLNNLTDELFEDDSLIEDSDDSQRIIIDAWLEDYDDSEIKSLESEILNLQKLKNELEA